MTTQPKPDIYGGSIPPGSDAKAFTAYAAAVMAAICFLLTACGPSGHYVTVTHHDLIIEKVYQADTQRSDLTPIFSSSGHIHLALTSSGSPEKYILIVKEEGHSARSIRVTPDTYAKAVKGQYLDVDAPHFVADKP